MKDEHPKHVCYKCIDDQFLASEVKSQNNLTLCSYCGETRGGTTLENLADRIHQVLQEHFELTPGYPSEPYEYMEASERRWERRGDPVESIIAEIAGLDEKIAGDLTALLSNRHGYPAMKGGEENPYGDEAMYEVRGPNDSGFRYTWAELRREIRSRSRFFSNESEEMLHFIFGDLDAHTAWDDRPVVREIKPDDQDASFWRGRPALSAGELEAILSSPSRELSSPPSRSAKPWRMNAQGIPVFYGAVDPRTCVSEVRPPVGAHVVVGKFDLLRPVRLLDLDALSNVYAEGSYFDPGHPEREGRAQFFRHLASEISRPVMPQDEALEYLTTQAVAEYLAHKVDPGIDGIIFVSSQTGGEGRNVVLFNHARGVEPHSFPEGTSVEVLLPRGGLDDLDDILIIETVPSKPADEDPPNVNAAAKQILVRSNIEEASDEVEEEEEPTLRLDIDSLKVLAVEAVAYTTKKLWVSRLRQTEEERDAFDQQFTETEVDSFADE